MPEEEYKCWFCGKVCRLKSEPRERYFCVECRQQQAKEHKKLIKEYGKIKIQVMHENALRTMEKAGVYMYEYQDASSKILRVAQEDTEVFFSSYEMITAMILEEFNYTYEVNKKILKYEVDFYIPEIKTCLEIDGHLHKFQPEYDSNRDIELRNHLGKEWEIIRIPTKYIDKNPEKIIEAIEVMKKEKQKLRNANKGIIPEYFSNREKSLYKNLTPYKTIKVRKI